MKRAFVVAVVLVVCSSAGDGSEIFYPADDARIVMKYPNYNYGDKTYMNVRNRYGHPSHPDYWQIDALVRFDLSSIPSGTSIDSATLYLYYYDYSMNDPQGRDLTLYRITNDWNEEAVTWDTQPGCTSEVTSYSIVPATFGWMDWDVTSDVQAYVDSQTPNYGWQIADTTTWRQFDIPSAKFHAKEAGGDLIPYLRVVIAPEPPCDSVGRCADSTYLYHHEMVPQDHYNTEATEAVPDGAACGSQGHVWFIHYMKGEDGAWWHDDWIVSPYDRAVIASYDTSSCQLLDTLKLEKTFGNVYRGLAYNENDNTFWYSYTWDVIIEPERLRHIDLSGNEIGDFYVDRILNGIAIDAANNHLWATIDGAPDSLVEYDISAGNPVINQGPMQVPWNSACAHGAAGLDYHDEHNMLIAVNSETGFLECFFDIDPGYSAGPGPDEPGVRLSEACWLSYTPTPRGIAFDEYTQTALVADNTPRLFPLDKYRPCGPATFIRGDADNDTIITMADALYILKCIYVPGSPCPSCDDAADADDDGVITMADGLYICRYLYVPGWPSPPPPCCDFPEDCGPDPTPDDLDCEDHPCQDPPTVSLSKSEEVDGNMVFGNATIQDQKVIVPVYLENNRPLSGFAYTISYDATALSFKSIDNTKLTTENFDFFSARPKEENGSVSVGSVVDLGLKKNLTPGYHKVSHLIFEFKTGKLEETILRFTDVQLVDTEAKPLSAHTNTCTIRIPPGIPRTFALHQTFPNPFTGETSIRYQLPKENHVALKVYNCAGQMVNTLVNAMQKPGYYRIQWNGENADGMKVASGIYFYKIETKDYSSTKKMILLR